MKGYRFKIWVKRLLKFKGYVVFRCSRSRHVDLAALKPGEKPLLAVRRGRGEEATPPDPLKTPTYRFGLGGGIYAGGADSSPK